MKQLRLAFFPVKYTLPFLVTAAVLVFLISFLIAVESFESLFAATLFTTPRGILLFVALPITVLAAAGFLIYLMISRAMRAGGLGRFGFKIFCIFAALCFAAVIPQTVLTGKFVGAALGTWFNNSVTMAMHSAEEFARLYIDEREHQLENISTRYFNGLAIQTYRVFHPDWMSEMRVIDANAAACQVYQIEETEESYVYFPIVEAGDSGVFLGEEQFSSIKNGLFAVTPEYPLLRYGQVVRYANNTYVCIYTSLLPADYHNKMSKIRDAYNQTLVVDKLEPLLPAAGFWIFILFLLPSLLMVFLLAYYACFRLSDPVRFLSEAALKIADTDYSYRIVPQKNDELGTLSSLVNAAADGMEEAKLHRRKVSVSDIETAMQQLEKMNPQFSKEE
ncbi:hypothetical protein K7I13_12960 [Brucepastera parasyntrophica]|uniref:hypothetical protein n=1 Tax=Brucepastera parasyntrophica TaxID=2880008 RepID=UPI00210CF8BB|nr:hypothetical protein [Brucepastera parasyntrophica]ULQ59375.1 hypothetical protein K7I13_12960 [Brucepastera parasyntrophica]